MTNKIIPRNLPSHSSGRAAREAMAYDVPGNPPTSRLEMGVGNCYPGLEYDHRNLDRRFFPGLVFEFVSAEDTVDAANVGVGARLVALDLEDSALNSVLREQLSERQRLLEDQATPWFLTSLMQRDVTIELRSADRAPLDGLIAWRLVRSLEPEEVEISLGRLGSEPIKLRATRRSYIDSVGSIDGVYRPGELTQSLCSPWTHDFRDCSCTYWASNHPDIVMSAAPSGSSALPSGLPSNGGALVDWLRADPDHAASALDQPDRRDFRYEVSHHEINQRWRSLPMVLEGQERGDDYFSRSTWIDRAEPFESADDLAEALVGLAGLEHLVALMYLSARYSVKSTDEISDAEEQRFGRLRDTAEYVRFRLLEVASSEMLHLRQVLRLTRKLSEMKIIADQPVSRLLLPAAAIPAAPPLNKDVPGGVVPLTLRTVDLFRDIEQPSAFIDGRYARVVATLRTADIPQHLDDIASQIARDGEEHFLWFKDMYAALRRISTEQTPWLRALSPASEAESAALRDSYKRMIGNLESGYVHVGAPAGAKIAEARRNMIDLDRELDAFARSGKSVWLG